MSDDALDARRGNLYGTNTLSGNWFEDRLQKTKGSTTDGLRGDTYTFNDGVGNSVVRQKESAISVCLVPDKNGGKAVGIAAAERYRRAANNPTTRVFPGCSDGTLASTSTYATPPFLHYVFVTFFQVPGELCAGVHYSRLSLSALCVTS